MHAGAERLKTTRRDGVLAEAACESAGESVGPAGRPSCRSFKSDTAGQWP